jgi:hypothetical protein
MSNYSWASHLQQVCRLLCKDGSGFTNVAPYAQDSLGNFVLYNDPQAVQWSLAGANYKVLNAAYPVESRRNAKIIALDIQRKKVMMSLYRKAGLVPVPNSVNTTVLQHFGRNEWPIVRDMLKMAYQIACKVETSKVR